MCMYMCEVYSCVLCIACRFMGPELNVGFSFVTMVVSAFWLCLYAGVCVCVCVRVCMCVCVHTYVCVCVCVCVWSSTSYGQDICQWGGEPILSLVNYQHCIVSTHRTNSCNNLTIVKEIAYLEQMTCMNPIVRQTMNQLCVKP